MVNPFTCISACIMASERERRAWVASLGPRMISSTSIKTEYTYLPNKPTTYHKETSKGSKGYKYRTYKMYYKGEELVKEEDLGISLYTMFPRKVEVGTMEVTEPTGDA